MVNDFIIRSFGLRAARILVFRSQFGKPMLVSGSKFPERGDNSESKRLNDGGSDENPTSVLGTPVFSDISFKTQDIEIKMETVLITVGQERNIITTVVQGRTGTIKEYVSDGDFSVRIQGAIVSPLTDSFPYDGIRELLEILKVQESIVVVSEYLRLFDIYDLVIKSYNFPQQEGFQNMQLFEIEAISDSDELLVEDA